MALIIISLIGCYYLVCGVSTTDILRLLKGATTPIAALHCYCDSCGAEVKFLEQTPILVYLIRKGRCKHCGAKIPVMTVLLEAGTFLLLTGTTALFGFRPLGVLVSFLLYEALKAAMILHFGCRESHFVRELLVSLGLNAVICALLMFIALIGVAIKGQAIAN